MNFVAARCPQCGGELQLDPEKELGFCMHCGSKIVIQDAIRAVRIDNSHMIDTWMEMADMAATSGNDEEAYDYYTKVLETQPNNWRASFGRGKAAGNQSTISNPRLLEVKVNFLKAINSIPIDDVDRKDLIFKSATELASIGAAMVKLRTDLFENHPDIDEAWGIKAELENVESVIDSYGREIDADISGYQDIIASNLISAVASTYNNKLSTDYNGEDGHPSADQLSEYRTGIDRCLDVLKFAKRLTNKDEVIIRINNNMITLNEASINSALWDYRWTSSGKIWQKRQIPASMSNTNRKNISDLKEENLLIIARQKKA